MPSPPCPSRQSVLLVDDDDALRRALSRCLSARYECLQAASAREASTVVTNRFVDVVLIDLTLHDGSGLDWITEHRRTCAGAGIIVLTGSMSQGDARRALELGADAVLLKPCPPSELTAAIERALALRDARRAIASCSA